MLTLRLISKHVCVHTCTFIKSNIGTCNPSISYRRRLSLRDLQNTPCLLNFLTIHHILRLPGQMLQYHCVSLLYELIRLQQKYVLISQALTYKEQNQNYGGTGLLVVLFLNVCLLCYNVGETKKILNFNY